MATSFISIPETIEKMLTSIFSIDTWRFNVLDICAAIKPLSTFSIMMMPRDYPLEVVPEVIRV
jgi:hypothetical protein